MKKRIIVLIMVCLFIGWVAESAYASNGSMGLYLNFGIMIDDSFSFDPILWTAGGEIDLHFGDRIMLSPEVLLVGYGFKFKTFMLFPGALLNVKLSNLFFGGGLTKGFLIGSDVEFQTDFALKLNAGFLGRQLKLTTYLITSFENFLKNMLVGITLGFEL